MEPRVQPWEPCTCGAYMCRTHLQHVHDCSCPPIEEWDYSPYADEAQAEPSQAEPEFEEVLFG